MSPNRDPGSPDRPVAYAGLTGLSWLSHSELDFLVNFLPPRGLFVEIGTAAGVSAAIIADRRPELRVLCIDSYPDHDEPHVVDREPCRIDAWRRNRRPNMDLFVGTAADWLILAGPARADAVLIDGAHDRKSVAADLRAAPGLLRPQGILLVHDCGEPALPEVAIAVRSFMKRYQFMIIDRHWTMCVLKSKD